jgi:AmiR/NasT family two-component response regulator
VLHEPHRDADNILRQLGRIGLTADLAWPDPVSSAARTDVVFFDADRGFDGQLGWLKGQAPMPLIALIGSEAPGRVEWALEQGCDAHLLKPIASAGVYSALLIAAHNFEARTRRDGDIETLTARLRKRPLVLKALLGLMHGGLDEDAATRRLRASAMEQGITIEDAAERFLAAGWRGVARART